MAITTIVKCEGIFGQQDRQIGEMSTIATALIGAHFCIVDSIEAAASLQILIIPCLMP